MKENTEEQSLTPSVVTDIGSVDEAVRAFNSQNFRIPGSEVHINGVDQFAYLIIENKGHSIDGYLVFRDSVRKPYILQVDLAQDVNLRTSFFSMPLTFSVAEILYAKVLNVNDRPHLARVDVVPGTKKLCSGLFYPI